MDDARPLEDRGRAGGRRGVGESDDGESDAEVKQPAQSGAGGWLLDSQGGAHSTVGQSSVTAFGPSVGETHRIAFLVRKAGESGSGSGGGSASAVRSGSSSGGGGVGRYMGSGMWSSLGMRGLGGGGGNGDSPSAGGGAGEEGNGATGMGGFGVDARKYVEGLLSLNR